MSVGEIVTGWPMVDPDRVDGLAWSTDVDRDDLTRDGVTYLLLQRLDGGLMGWAPLGSPKPFVRGEGVRWQIRVVRP